MGLLADLLDAVRAAPGVVATQAIAGRRFTAIAGAVPGSPAAAGLAYTARGEDDPHYDVAGASAALGAGVLGHPLQTLAGLVLPDSGRPEVGAAALNALLATLLPAAGVAPGTENGLDLVVRLAAGKRLAMVGHFPYLNQARLRATRHWILELEPEGDDLPAAAAPQVLPQADVVGVTGSTLANGTLEGVLALCRPEATVVLIGPTTPLSPVLFDYGADVLCGVLVEEPQRTLAVLADASVKPRPRIPGTRLVSLVRPGFRPNGA